ncbi:hypothetical protein SLS62_008430 [Diatrype stigma]|uniref:Ubiquitin-like domain-containing protein n=1 Tax=Diatrype stigma TaxID=117547 RepID=A0AAN9ULR7_9PEZI
MAETAGPSAGGDQGPKEEQLSIHQPAGDVEMEDLSSIQPKPANPDGPPASPSLSPSSPQRNDAELPAAAIPSPALGALSNSGEHEGQSKAEDKAEDDPSGKAQDKAPATITTTAATTTAENADLTIEPAATAADADSSDAAASDISVEIMLLLTTGARHPFRIDEKYLTKRNVTVTGKTEEGKTDPSSITVYTLKELILRDWRKEWDQPPREPSAIRLIHFGRMLEDRMPLNHYQFSNTSRNVVHMTVKPQDIIDEEEAAKKVKESSHHGGRSGCCVIL